MNAEPVPSPSAAALRLVAELASVLPTLAPHDLAELRPAVARVADDLLSRVLAATAVGQEPATPKGEFTFREAAAELKVSERWLRGHLRELRIGYQMAGRWRFSAKELDGVRDRARRRARS